LELNGQVTKLLRGERSIKEPGRALHVSQTTIATLKTQARNYEKKAQELK